MSQDLTSLPAKDPAGTIGDNASRRSGRQVLPSILEERASRPKPCQAHFHYLIQCTYGNDFLLGQHPQKLLSKTPGHRSTSQGFVFESERKLLGAEGQDSEALCSNPTAFPEDSWAVFSVPFFSFSPLPSTSFYFHLRCQGCAAFSAPPRAACNAGGVHACSPIRTWVYLHHPSLCSGGSAW